MMSLKYISYIVLLSFLIKLSFSGFAKKYHVAVQSVNICPDNEKLESPLRNLKFTKINATFGTMTYDITYKRPLDEKVGIQLKLEKWTEQGWASFPLFPFQKDVCRSSLKSPLIRDMWINWSRQMGVPEPEKCPIPAGNYSMRNGLLDLGLVKKIPIWNGQYKTWIIEKLVDSEQWIYCLQINFDLKEIL